MTYINHDGLSLTEWSYRVSGLHEREGSIFAALVVCLIVLVAILWAAPLWQNKDAHFRWASFWFVPDLIGDDFYIWWAKFTTYFISMSVFLRILGRITLLSVLFGSFWVSAYAVPTVSDFNLRNDAKSGTSHAGYIDSFKSSFWGYFFGGSLTGERGAKYLLVTIARDLKNLMIFIAVVYLFILVLRVLFSHGSDDDAKKWRLGIMWTSLGIVLMQVAYVFISTLFDRQVAGYTASVFLDNVVYPFVRMLELLASFVFLAMAFYAFFKIITAGGEEDKIKKGKQTIIYALVGFLLIKVPGVLVTSIYGKAECSRTILGICEMTISDPNLSDTTRIMTKFINYFNGFIGLVTLLLIIYAGWLVVSSAGDDEKVKKAKKIVQYAVMGIFLLVASYSLFNFFILKG